MKVVFLRKGFQEPGVVPRHFLNTRGIMLEISVFADESGEEDSESKYYLLTLVFHEQSNDVAIPIRLYQQDLINKKLPDIPLHASPLMNGKDEYKGLDIQDRKRLLQSFFIFLQHLPIKYRTLAYEKNQFSSRQNLMARMRRDLINLIFDNLAYFQRFTTVKVYYDDGQSTVTSVLHDAIEYALYTNAITYRNAGPKEYRLAQAADLICTFELTAIKYSAREQTNTDTRFFGAQGSFKKNYLKKIRKKLL